LPFEFELTNKIILRNIEEFDKVVMEFFFKKQPEGGKPRALLFAKKDTIFELDIETEAITKVHEFKDIPFNLPPSHFECNDE